LPPIFFGRSVRTTCPRVVVVVHRLGVFVLAAHLLREVGADDVPPCRGRRRAPDARGVELVAFDVFLVAITISVVPGSTRIA